MSHDTQLRFVELVASKNRSLLRQASVLEIGSFDVNGSVRQILAEAPKYVGVDLVEGPGVDIVAFGHEVDGPDGSYDVTVSCECFEHDVHWASTLRNMTRLTRSGGLVVFTCAGRGRPEHGTRRTIPADSPGTQWEGIDYYMNLEQHDIEEAIDLPSEFSSWIFGYQEDYCDLYFAGIRKPVDPDLRLAHLPTPIEIASIRGMVPLKVRFKRLPWRAIHRVVSEARYQNLYIGYRTAIARLRKQTK